VPLALSNAFRVLTCSCLRARQTVSLAHPHSFTVLICPSLCARQYVSAPRSLSFFLCADLPLLRLIVRECPSLAPCPDLPLCGRQLVSALKESHSFRVLTCPCLRPRQRVSGPRLLAFFPFPELSPLRWTGRECPSLAFSPCLNLSLLYAGQFVSASRSLTFISCPNLSLLPRCIGSEYPSLAHRVLSLS